MVGTTWENGTPTKSIAAAYTEIERFLCTNAGLKSHHAEESHITQCKCEMEESHITRRKATSFCDNPNGTAASLCTSTVFHLAPLSTPPFVGLCFFRLWLQYGFGTKINMNQPFLREFDAKSSENQLVQLSSPGVIPLHHPPWIANSIQVYMIPFINDVYPPGN